MGDCAPTIARSEPQEKPGIGIVSRMSQFKHVGFRMNMWEQNMWVICWLFMKEFLYSLYFSKLQVIRREKGEDMELRASSMGWGDALLSKLFLWLIQSRLLGRDD